VVAVDSPPLEDGGVDPGFDVSVFDVSGFDVELVPPSADFAPLAASVDAPAFFSASIAFFRDADG
jgi:hypothetical protein